jgi:L-fuculose-phosphate aldolase
VHSAEKPFTFEVGEIPTDGRRGDPERLFELRRGLESALSERSQNRDATVSDMHDTDGIKSITAIQSISLKIDVSDDPTKIFRYIGAMRTTYSPTSVFPSPPEDLAQTLRRIYDLDLTTTSGGNLSLRDDDGCIWITPAGIDKGELRADQIARVGGPGVDSKGIQNPPPSSELPFHQALYAARPDLHSIVHAHPISLVAFSIAQQVPDSRVSANGYALCGTIGFAPYALPGSRELGEEIARTFAKGFDCVVLENHGVVVGGTTLRQAFERLEALDLCARTIMRARSIGSEQLLSWDDLALALASRPVASSAMRERKLITDRERELRQTLCTIARRARKKRLMTSTQGTLSARLPEDAFLLTPASVSPDRLEPSDLLRVGLRRSGLVAHDSREALHAAVYRAHPEVGAIAQGCPENVAGFSAAEIPLPSRTIPESYILIREPVSVSFREAITDPEGVAARISPDNPVALIHNDGVLTLGASVLDAFDRLEVLEATAAAVIASRPLGELAPMNDQQLSELRNAFFPTGGFQGSPHGE